MQLITQQENVDDEETRHNSRQSVKMKYSHRHRRRKMIHSVSEDTVLEFDENENSKTPLPDLIRDTDFNDNNNMYSSYDNSEVHRPASESTLDQNDSPKITNHWSPGNESTQKKFSLPNNIITRTSIQSHSESNSPDIGAMKKKFSLPGDIDKDHITNDQFILDVHNLRMKYDSSTSLPSDGRKHEYSIENDYCLSKKHNSIDGSENRCRLDDKVGEFVHEVMSSISEIGYGNPGDGVRKLRGIIKKTLSCEKDETGSNKICIRRREKCKNNVHFSEQNITIEIPRPSRPYFRKVQDKFSYYCCFGFLFPNS